VDDDPLPDEIAEALRAAAVELVERWLFEVAVWYMLDSRLEWSTLQYASSVTSEMSWIGRPLGGQDEWVSSSPYIEYISMVVSEEPLGLSSEDCVSPGVDGTVEYEGDGEDAGLASRGLGGMTTRFGVSIKRERE